MDYSALFATQSHLDIDIGRIIPLCKMNQLLLSKSDPFCMNNKLTLLNSDIVKHKNGIYYLNLSKLGMYLEMIQNSFDMDDMNYFPYNYFKFINKEKIPEHFQKMISAIDSYYSYLKTKDNHFSKTIMNILFNKMNMFNGEVVSAFDDTVCVKFDKIGKLLYINFTYSEASLPNKLTLIDYNNEDNLEKLFEDHKKLLLMDNPDEFLINNLERVTGDYNFAKMCVSSYIEKYQYTTPLEGLIELMDFGWKDNKMKQEYLTFFINKYKHLIQEDEMGKLYTNFEGFNKFLLSIEEKYIKRWEVKEQINELYYQITHELIYSFEQLYNNK
jgi:hypothetical protein